MRNSEFQKVYSKIIAQQSQLKKYKKNKKKIISEDLIPVPEFMKDIVGGVVQPLAGVVKSGVSLAKGDLKGAAEGVKDVLTSPAKVVKGVLEAPGEVIQKTVQITKQLTDHPEAQQKIDDAAKQIPDDAAKQFQAAHPELKNANINQIKQVVVVTGIAQHATDTAVQAQQNGGDKKNDLKQILQKFKVLLADFNDGKYPITL